MKIVHDFEGANIQVLSQTETEVHVEVELRDSQGDWFFWCFKVEGAAGRTVTFRFPNWARVGYFGAAVSHDYQTWHWQYAESGHQGDSFTYPFAADEDSVYFAHDMVYRPERFTAFAEANGLERKTLCMSEKGRAVPYVEFGTGEEIVFLTARHHACESTGSYVLEGVLSEMRKIPEDRYHVICVPFVDYDGVVDGDQGKNRNGHDHNRDYNVNALPRYSTIRAIQKLVEEKKLRYAFDFHSPWHLNEENDTVFIVEKKGTPEAELKMFTGRLEALTKSNSSALPYAAKNNVPFGVKWNTNAAPTSFASYMQTRGAQLFFTLETAYFCASGISFSPERAFETGRCFVQALP